MKSLVSKADCRFIGICLLHREALELVSGPYVVQVERGPGGAKQRVIELDYVSEFGLVDGDNRVTPSRRGFVCKRTSLALKGMIVDRVGVCW